jgi:predicted methyltransferase MtxX (methanogen marker protein 4)
VVFLILGVFKIKSAGTTLLGCDAVFIVTAMRASPLRYFSALNLTIRLYC